MSLHAAARTVYLPAMSTVTDEKIGPAVQRFVDAWRATMVSKNVGDKPSHITWGPTTCVDGDNNSSLWDTQLLFQRTANIVATLRVIVRQTDGGIKFTWSNRTVADGDDMREIHAAMTAWLWAKLDASGLLV